MGGESSLGAVLSVFSGQEEVVFVVSVQWKSCEETGSPRISNGPQQLKDKWSHVNIELVDTV